MAFSAVPPLPPERPHWIYASSPPAPMLSSRDCAPPNRHRVLTVRCDPWTRTQHPSAAVPLLHQPAHRLRVARCCLRLEVNFPFSYSSSQRNTAHAYLSAKPIAWAARSWNRTSKRNDLRLVALAPAAQALGRAKALVSQKKKWERADAITRHNRTS
jgi:hypothetical protein